MSEMFDGNNRSRTAVPPVTLVSAAISRRISHLKIFSVGTFAGDRASQSQSLENASLLIGGSSMRIVVLCLAVVLLILSARGPSGDDSSVLRPNGRAKLANTSASIRMPSQDRSRFDPLAKDSSAEFDQSDPLVPPIVLTGLGHESQSDLHDVGNAFGIPEASFSADFHSDPLAVFHAHGEEVCASGCALSNHPTSELSGAHFDRLLRKFAEQPMDETSTALEALLYHGRQTRALLQRRGTGPLDDQRAQFLRRELLQTHALVSFRVVDEHGHVRTQMQRVRVPFDRRHVFEMEVNDLPPLMTSGTVKRVGLHHLWTRL